MSDEKTVHAQQIGGPWAKSWDDQVARVTAFGERIGQVEAQALERARAAIDESARMQKETLAYWAEMGTAMRSIGLDMARQAAAFWRGGV